MKNFKEFIGKEVVYTSASFKKYKAIIVGISDNPKNEYTDLPTVSLEFRDEKNKLVKKNRVIPAENYNGSKSRTYIIA